MFGLLIAIGLYVLAAAWGVTGGPVLITQILLLVSAIACLVLGVMTLRASPRAMSIPGPIYAGIGVVGLGLLTIMMVSINTASTEWWVIFALLMGLFWLLALGLIIYGLVKSILDARSSRRT